MQHRYSQFNEGLYNIDCFGRCHALSKLEINFICSNNDAAAAGLAKSLGKRIGKAVTEAGEISGRLTAFIEILKASKMIRIYQKEEIEFKKSKDIITQMDNKGAKLPQ